METSNGNSNKGKSKRTSSKPRRAKPSAGQSKNNFLEWFATLGVEEQKEGNNRQHASPSTKAKTNTKPVKAETNKKGQWGASVRKEIRNLSEQSSFVVKRKNGLLPRVAMLAAKRRGREREVESAKELLNGAKIARGGSSGGGGSSSDNENTRTRQRRSKTDPQQPPLNTLLPVASAAWLAQTSGALFSYKLDATDNEMCLPGLFFVERFIHIFRNNKNTSACRSGIRQHQQKNSTASNLIHPGTNTRIDDPMNARCRIPTTLLIQTGEQSAAAEARSNSNKVFATLLHHHPDQQTSIVEDYEDYENLQQSVGYIVDLFANESSTRVSNNNGHQSVQQHYQQRVNMSNNNRNQGDSRSSSREDERRSAGLPIAVVKRLRVVRSEIVPSDPSFIQNEHDHVSSSLSDVEHASVILGSHLRTEVSFVWTRKELAQILTSGIQASQTILNASSRTSPTNIDHGKHQPNIARTMNVRQASSDGPECDVLDPHSHSRAGMRVTDHSRLSKCPIMIQPFIKARGRQPWIARVEWMANREPTVWVVSSTHAYNKNNNNNNNNNAHDISHQSNFNNSTTTDTDTIQQQLTASITQTHELAPDGLRAPLPSSTGVEIGSETVTGGATASVAYTINRSVGSAWRAPKDAVARLVQVMDQASNVLPTNTQVCRLVVDMIHDDQGVWWLLQVKHIHLRKVPPPPLPLPSPLLRRVIARQPNAKDPNSKDPNSTTNTIHATLPPTKRRTTSHTKNTMGSSGAGRECPGMYCDETLNDNSSGGNFDYVGASDVMVWPARHSNITAKKGSGKYLSIKRVVLRTILLDRCETDMCAASQAAATQAASSLDRKSDQDNDDNDAEDAHKCCINAMERSRQYDLVAVCASCYDVYGERARSATLKQKASAQSRKRQAQRDQLRSLPAAINSNAKVKSKEQEGLSDENKGSSDGAASYVNGGGGLKAKRSVLRLGGIKILTKKGSTKKSSKSTKKQITTSTKKRGQRGGGRGGKNSNSSEEDDDYEDGTVQGGNDTSMADGLVPCPYGCGLAVSEAEQGMHAITTCPLRIVECRRCAQSVQHNQLLWHETSNCKPAMDQAAAAVTAATAALETTTTTSATTTARERGELSVENEDTSHIIEEVDDDTNTVDSTNHSNDHGNSANMNELETTVPSSPLPELVCKDITCASVFGGGTEKQRVCHVVAEALRQGRCVRLEASIEANNCSLEECKLALRSLYLEFRGLCLDKGYFPKVPIERSSAVMALQPKANADTTLTDTQE